LAAASIRKIHYTLSAAYERGVRWRWLAVNPTKQTKPPPPAPASPTPPRPPRTPPAPRQGLVDRSRVGALPVAGDDHRRPPRRAVRRAMAPRGPR
jgi:hypothetical protein